MKNNNEDVLFMKIKVKIINAFNFIIEKFIPWILPSVLLLFYVVIIIFKTKFISLNSLKLGIDTFLKEIFKDGRMSMLSTISVVSIGLYVTVMSVFGSSQSSAVSQMSKGRLTNRFIRYASESLMSAFVYLIITIFYNEIIVGFYSIIFIWMIGNFIRFTLIILKMYKHNIKNTELLESEDKIEKKEILKLLILINNRLNNSDSKDNEYFEYIKRTNEEKRNNDNGGI